MHVDLYTKAVLTIIAVSVAYLASQAPVQPVHAHGEQRVVIVKSEQILPVGLTGTWNSEQRNWDWNQPVHVGITGVGRRPNQPWQPIDVRAVNRPAQSPLTK
jgi:hypothetical protein